MKQSHSSLSPLHDVESQDLPVQKKPDFTPPLAPLSPPDIRSPTPLPRPAGLSAPLMLPSVAPSPVSGAGRSPDLNKPLPKIRAVRESAHRVRSQLSRQSEASSVYDFKAYADGRISVHKAKRGEGSKSW